MMFRNKTKKQRMTVIHIIMFIMCLGLFVTSIIKFIDGWGYQHAYSSYTFGVVSPLGVMVFTGLVCAVFIYGAFCRVFPKSEKQKDSEFERRFLSTLKNYQASKNKNSDVE